MGNIELAILAKIVFYEELRDGINDFSDMIAEGTETETEWKIHYIAFMKQLNNMRIKAVGRLIHEINYEDISFY